MEKNADFKFIEFYDKELAFEVNNVDSSNCYVKEKGCMLNFRFLLSTEIQSVKFQSKYINSLTETLTSKTFTVKFI